MCKRTFIIFILLLYIAIQVIAYPYTVRHLDSSIGLSNNYINDMVQDKHGRIWATTEFGLSRFDGYSFYTYNKNNSSFKEESFGNILYDKSEDKLWISAKFRGVYTLDCSTNKIEYYSTFNGDRLQTCSALSQASDGGIWLALGGGNVIHYDKRTNKFTSLRNMGYKLQKHRAMCIYDDRKGNLYIGHRNDGFTILNLKSHHSITFQNNPKDKYSLPGNDIYVICRDHKDNIWLGTNYGLALYNPSRHNFIVFRHKHGDKQSLLSDHIYDIRDMGDGKLWIATDIGGISILDIDALTFTKPEDVVFENLSVDNEDYILSSRSIRKILIDRYNNVWLGNYGCGIDLIEKQKNPFHVLPYVHIMGNTFKHKPVWGVANGIGNDTWLGSENEIALFHNGRQSKIYDFSNYLSRTYGQTYSLCYLNDGNLLLGIFDNGLIHFDTHSHRFKSVSLGQEHVDVFNFFKEKNGNILVGSEIGIYVYNKGKATYLSDINNKLHDKAIYGMVRDWQGNLWIGTYSLGIYIFDNNNQQIKHLTKDNGLCTNAINSLYMDHNGCIWASTRNGIAQFADTRHPEHFKCYGYKNGLTDTYVRATIEDKYGNIWLSANNTISFWNKKTRHFENYDYNDGIARGNYIEGSACRMNDGTIYFGSLSGASYFRPEDVLIKKKVSVVRITECSILDDSSENEEHGSTIASLSGNIALPYNENSVAVSFTVDNLAQCKQVEYAYKVDGLDDTWTSSLGENSITLRNLHHGTYIFMVKARLRNQPWDEAHVASMTITIKPPFWLAWYAKLFYCLTILTVLYTSAKYYQIKLKKKTVQKWRQKRHMMNRN
jgi:ligand-binding sensor domain-containing protein